MYIYMHIYIYLCIYISVNKSSIVQLDLPPPDQTKHTNPHTHHKL